MEAKSNALKQVDRDVGAFLTCMKIVHSSLIAFEQGPKALAKGAKRHKWWVTRCFLDTSFVSGHESVRSLDRA